MKIQDTLIRVFDTETTGFDPKTETVVELAYADFRWDGKKLQFQSSSEWLINPGKPIPLKAMAVHHITDKMVHGKPELPVILNQFAGQHYLPVAFNAAFDLPFMKMDPDNSHWCIMRIARHLWPQYESHSNQYLRYALGLEIELPEGVRPHRAMADVIVSAAILERQLVLLQTLLGEDFTVEGLDAYSRQPVVQKVCRFGAKHYNQPWSEVPLSYMMWMKREVKDLDPDTQWNVDNAIAAKRTIK